MNETIDPAVASPTEVRALHQRVVELEQALTSIRARETRYQLLVEHATDMFSCHTPDGAYLYISSACQQLLGYTPDELLGHRPYELFHPDDITTLQHTLTPVLDHAHATTVTFRHRRKDGTYIWLETTSHPICDPVTGALIELHAISRDVSARKQVEQALIESEARFRQMAENIHEVFWLTDVHKQQMLYISPAYERIWGRTCDSLYAAPESFVEAIHPEDRERIRACLSQQGQGHYDEEYRVVRPDGTIRWVRDQGFPIADAQGQVTRVAGVVADITVRKAQAATAQAAHDHLHSVLARLDQCVWSLDLLTNTFRYLSPACDAIYGVSSGCLQANPMLLRDHIHPDDLALADAAEANLWRGQIASSEYRIIRADGTLRWVAVDVKPVLDAQGQLVQLDGIVTDVTARKAAEVERERMQAQLIQLQQAALAELSTPLIPITDDIVVMPLIGALDTQRVQQVLTTLLQGVERSRAGSVILDITGVPVVDTQVANTLIGAAQAVKLLGAQVILTGIRPEVAQTLVMLGVDLRTMVTHSSLQRGIAYATAR